MLVIDNAKYSISDLDTVVSTEYSQAYGKYSTFKGMIDSLPDVAYADKSYENVIQGAFDFYNTMNDYEKNYMAFYGADQMEKFTQWKLELENLGIEFKDSSKEEENKTSLDDILESFNTKMNAIIDKLNLLSNNSSSGSTDKTEQDSDNKTEDTDKTNDSDKTGNTDKTDGTNKTEGSDNTNTGDTSGSDNTDNTSGSDSTNTDNTTGSDSTNDSDNTTGSDNTSSADNTTGSDSTNNTGSTADSDSANNASNSDNADTHTT